MYYSILNNQEKIARALEILMTLFICQVTYNGIHIVLFCTLLNQNTISQQMIINFILWSFQMILYLCIIRFSISEVKVVDLIQFNGDVLADLRLKYLDEMVDLFAIVEGTYTFNGVRKEKLYMDIHEDWFKEVEGKNKVLKIVFDEKPTINKGFNLNIFSLCSYLVRYSPICKFFF